MKPKIPAYLFIALALLALLFSCRNRPKEVLNRKSMEGLMYDVYMAEALIENDYQTYDTPEKKEAFLQKIFEKHQVTQVQWDSSLAWYADRIDVYMKMNDSVKARLQRKQQELDASITQQVQAQQFESHSESPSYIPHTYAFRRIGSGSGFRFRIDSAEINTRFTNPTLEFRYNVIGIPDDVQEAPLQSMLILEYKDTTLYKPQQITQNKSYSTPVSRYIDGDTLTRISGFIHLKNTWRRLRYIQLYNIGLGKNDIPGPEPMPPAEMKETGQ